MVKYSIIIFKYSIIVVKYSIIMVKYSIIIMVKYSIIIMVKYSITMVKYSIIVVKYSIIMVDTVIMSGVSCIGLLAVLINMYVFLARSYASLKLISETNHWWLVKFGSIIKQ